jgi:hypothetical protein
MPGKSRQAKPKSVLKGQSAISRIIKNSRDQVIDVAKRRYYDGGISQVKADIQSLRRMLNTEEKRIDTTLTATTVKSDTSLITGIGTMAEGSDSNQRTGRSVKVVRIDISMAFQFSSGVAATAINQAQNFKYYIVKYNKTTSNSAFAIADFLNQDPGSNYTPLSLPNPDLNQNFTVLDTGLVDVVLPNIPATNAYVAKIVDISINRAFHQTYSSTTAASITDNMIFAVFTAFQPGNSGGNTNVAFSARCWYVDN